MHVLVLLALLAFQSGDDYGRDPSAIKWQVPGTFGEALARAKKEKRILLIKGIAFGIDEEGAKDATCGTW